MALMAVYKRAEPSEWFKHRLIPNLTTLKQQIQRGLPTVDEPNIWNYLCP